MVIGEMDIATLGIIITMFIATWTIIFPTLMSLRKEVSELTSISKIEITNLKKEVEEIKEVISSCRTCKSEIMRDKIFI